MPQQVDSINNGESIKDLRLRLQKQLESIHDLFTKTYEPLKNTVAKFRNATQIFGRVTEDLQEGVMKIRMVPISQLFSRFPRLSR
jgi:two-component system chemotaxis sensor kinase CheA